LVTEKKKVFGRIVYRWGGGGWRVPARLTTSRENILLPLFLFMGGMTRTEAVAESYGRLMGRSSVSPSARKKAGNSISPGADPALEEARIRLWAARFGSGNGAAPPKSWVPGLPRISSRRCRRMPIAFEERRKANPRRRSHAWRPSGRTTKGGNFWHLAGSPVPNSTRLFDRVEVGGKSSGGSSG